MPTNFSLPRREFLKDLGLTASAALLWSLGGCEQLIEIIEDRRVRRNVANLMPTDPILQTYKTAITAMKNVPSSDQRNWTNQASIHFNHCAHRNWYLLPWHRAYLLYFETICQKLGGDDKFALPYWNWTANPSVPAVYWGGTSNPLFDARQIGPNDMADPSWVGQSVMENILNQPDFFLFASGKVSGQRDSDTQGQLESTPHNNIHGWIGRDMGTFMSPLDPIFWQHHAMIDYCWVEWNLNRNHPNVNDSSWLNFTFSDFVDANSSPVKVTVADTILYPILVYRYEPSQMGTHISTELNIRTRADAKKLETFLRKGAPPRLEFTNRYQLSRALTVEAGRPLAGSLTLDAQQVRAALAVQTDRFVLTLKNVELPQTADYFVRVFLDKPDASAQTSIDDVHYAGSFSFFVDPNSPHSQDAVSHTLSIAIDISETLRRLGGSGALSSMAGVDVQLVPVAYAGRPAQGQRFLFEGLELAIARVL